ncbi:MAG: sulfite exporter TauE/SafE family protein [Gammaproteobacteria bacterium]|nr:sulfite exporter TauE/SafE family protein [Gammaproteobacteria bacterium]
MELSLQTYVMATSLLLIIALVFSMLGLGGGVLYVPVFKWLALPVKTVVVPLSLLLNGVTTASAFTRYAREGMVDFRSGLPAALTALAAASCWRWWRSVTTTAACASPPGVP